MSITPVSAVEISNQQDNQYQEVRKSLDSMDQNINDLKDIQTSLKNHIDTINNDLNYISGNWYKFWKWGEVKSSMDDINHQKDMMMTNLDDLKVTSQKINGNLNELEYINQTLTNTTDDNESYTWNSYNLANHIKIQLSYKNISVEISKPTNFKEGDLVQYFDDGKYYKYLVYMGIDNKTNYVKLKDRNRDDIVVSQKKFNDSAACKLSCPTNRELLVPVNHVLENDIKNLNDSYDKEITFANEMDNYTSQASTALLWATPLLLVLGLVGALLCFSYPEAGITLSLTASGTLLAIGIFAVVVSCLKDKANNKASQIFEERTNLYETIYHSIHSFPVAADYNITTNVNKPVSGGITCEFDAVFDYFVLYSVVKKPEHGSLKLSEYRDYVYTPDANFTGTDSFKYKANDGLYDSNVAEVFINVSTIPTHMLLNNVTDLQPHELTATLLDDHNKIIPNQTIQFILNNQYIGETKTDENGIASLQLDIIPLIMNQTTFKAIYLGDSQFSGSNATIVINTLTK